jgi:hypothetical protein
MVGVALGDTNLGYNGPIVGHTAKCCVKPTDALRLFFR